MSSIADHVNDEAQTGDSIPASSAPKSPVAACLYCGGTQYDPWLEGIRDRLGFVSGEWSFQRCTGCGSATLSPTPRAEELAAFYPPVYTFSPEIAGQSRLKSLLATLEYKLFFRPMYRAQARIVRRYCERRGIEGRQLLDIGCGRGLRLLEFRRQGFDVHGCDFSHEAIEYLRTQQGIPAHEADFCELDAHFPPNSFDIITGFYVLEHVTDVRSVLAACHRVLRPGGAIAMVLPLADSTQVRCLGGRWTSAAEAPRHISIPSRQALTDLVTSVGFNGATVELRADATLANAGVAGLSLFPASAASNVYGARRVWPMIARVLGAVATVGSIPWALADEWIFRRPGLGIVFGQKT